MKAKNKLIKLLVAIVALVGIWAIGNILVDPSNAFGDVVLAWDSYDMTNSPGVAKISYLEKHSEDYDSFIIGSVSAASYDVDYLNKELNAQFYNLYSDEVDTDTNIELTKYLVKNYKCKNIILNIAINDLIYYDEIDNSNINLHNHVSGENSFKYYGKYLFNSPDYSIKKLSSYSKNTLLPQTFDAIIPQTGCYDNSVCDVEPIDSLNDYLEINEPNFSNQNSHKNLIDIDDWISSIEKTKKICENNNVNFMVIFSPICSRQLDMCSMQTLKDYMTKLAHVTDYWNFSISPITYDERYFYDSMTSRTAVCDMMLAKIFNKSDVYIPEDFGTYITKDNVYEYCRQVIKPRSNIDYDDYTENVPVFIFHHLGKGDGSTETPKSFAKQMKCLYENGYKAVGLEELIQYVYKGKNLVEKPVVITFDDGYYSNYKYAYPILKKYNFKATIFPIGVSIGHMKYYKDTNYSLIPHFGFDEMGEMLNSGLISFQNHTYDMHQWTPYESGDKTRTNILKLDNETEEEYVSALKEDFGKEADILHRGGVENIYAVAFPGGKTSVLTEVILKELGVKITVTTDDSKVNTLVKGLPSSLIDLGRKELNNSTTDKELLDYLDEYYQQR